MIGFARTTSEDSYMQQHALSLALAIASFTRLLSGSFPFMSYYLLLLAFTRYSLSFVLARIHRMAAIHTHGLDLYDSDCFLWIAYDDGLVFFFSLCPGY